jgi:hypothetical protein
LRARTWTKGTLRSDNAPNLMVNALGRGVHGAYLMLNPACDVNNPDCRFLSIRFGE